MSSITIDRQIVNSVIRGVVDSTGYDEAMLLADSAIVPTSSGNQERVPYADMAAFWRSAEQITGRPEIGLSARRYFHLGDLGALGYAMLSANTPMEALEDFVRYGSHLSEAWKYSIHTENGQTIVEGRSAIHQEDTTHHPLDLVISCSAKMLRGVISGGFLKVKEAHFIHDGFGLKDSYEAELECVCKFNQPVAALVFDEVLLRQPMPAADPDLHHALKSRLDAQSSTNQPWTGAVSQSILYLKSKQKKVSREAVSRHLNLSERSLLRRLSAEGQTYKGVLEQCQTELAMQFIRQGLSTVSIAEQLGYYDASALSKMLKRRTGKSIRELSRPAK